MNVQIITHIQVDNMDTNEGRDLVNDIVGKISDIVVETGVGNIESGIIDSMIVVKPEPLNSGEVEFIKDAIEGALYVALPTDSLEFMKMAEESGVAVN